MGLLTAEAVGSAGAQEALQRESSVSLPFCSLLPKDDAEGDWAMAQALRTHWLRNPEVLGLYLVPNLSQPNVLLPAFLTSHCYSRDPSWPSYGPFLNFSLQRPRTLKAAAGKNACRNTHTHVKQAHMSTHMHTHVCTHTTKTPWKSWPRNVNCSEPGSGERRGIERLKQVD